MIKSGVNLLYINELRQNLEICCNLRHGSELQEIPRTSSKWTIFDPKFERSAETSPQILYWCGLKR